MMQANQSEAERRFWETPELLETLFLSLDDLESTLSLARVVDQKNLQRSMTSKVWSKLIRQNCPSAESGLLLGKYVRGLVREQDRLLEATLKVKNLASILKLMKEPKDLLLDLLDVICERVPSILLPFGSCEQLQMVCPRHPDSHSVSPAGFLLLEEVERVLGTAEQRIESIEVGHLSEQVLFAIVARMSRQQEAAISIRICGSIKIESEKGAQAFYTLMSNQVEPGIGLKVLGSIGEGGWEALAKAMQLQPDVVGHVVTSKTGLEEAMKEDIKNVWESVQESQGFDIYKTAEDIPPILFGPYAPVSVRKPGDDWGRLEQIMHMSEAEFAAEIGEDLWREGLYNPEEREDEDSEGEEEEGEDPETGDGEDEDE